MFTDVNLRMFTFVKLKLIMLDISSFLSQYQSLKAIALRNRYVTNFHIEPLLKSLSNQFSQTVLGTSHFCLEEAMKALGQVSL